MSLLHMAPLISLLAGTKAYYSSAMPSDMSYRASSLVLIPTWYPRSYLQGYAIKIPVALALIWDKYPCPGIHLGKRDVIPCFNGL
ncbi:hypothetical protein F4813DRAFT_346067 [Daldinia decipiens]|uniref:uncharacterized protein n=1 Tax=Daldinia decipiens TaxID=326647 RepID=UPI0020C4A713|nr:uncharacterized protein F4813DRAFT_346067 [Daldinia decipiens]KAI1661881.1 hypothetical protein F4813DRAFT_346067 [Daldinia decipiens]